jgi:excisionase family DNA binding protein
MRKAVNDFLTAREVQDLLKVDRTTVYRMLKDGRLAGVKVGQQWRFSQAEVEALLSGKEQDDDSLATSLTTVLPLHCIQAMQNVFAEVAEVGSVTTAPNGEPLTKISNSCRFCNLILASQSGRRACVASWQKLAEQPERQPRFVTCHAGLQYACARIEVGKTSIAMLIAGQFYLTPPDHDEQATRIRQLAALHGLNQQALGNAAATLLILDERKQAQIGKWLETVAHTFEQIAHERAELMGRLRRIAAISDLEAE